MTNQYKVTNCAKINGTELVNLIKLDAAGVSLPGSTLQIHAPKGSGLFAQFDDGDIVAVSIEKYAPGS